MISIYFQGKPFNITVIQVYVPTTNAEEAEVEDFNEVCGDIQDLLELTPQKDVIFHYRRLECKAGNQEIPGVTGKSDPEVQNEAGQRLKVLSREHTSHNKRSLPTTQEKTLHMDITRWSTLISN